MMIINVRKPKTLLLIKDNHTNSWHSAYFSEKKCDDYVCSNDICNNERACLLRFSVLPGSHRCLAPLKSHRDVY